MRILLLVLFINVSCTSKNNRIINSKPSYPFKEFISRQKIIKLPYRLELYKNYTDLVEPIPSDTSIFQNSTPMWSLGLLEDTSKFYCVIPLYPGDDLCPILYVFNKDGRLIDKEGLMIGKYGIGCGSNVYGYVLINKDLSIFSKDSLAQYYCDSLDVEDKTNVTIYTNSQKIWVLSQGKIEKSKVNEMIIKKFSPHETLRTMQEL